MNNLQIAELLRDMAAAYQLKDQKKYKFQIIAYQRAADAVEHAASELKDLWDDGKLDEVPGIGPGIASHLDELFKKGKSKHFEEVMKGLPKIMFEYMKLPGIGPKTAFKLVKELGLKTMGDLKKAAKAGKIAKLEGFGEESQKAILTVLSESRKKETRHLLPYAQQIAQRLIDYLLKSKHTLHADPLGSLRRQVSTIGDIDIAASSKEPEKVIEHFTKYPDCQRVIERGTRTASILAPGGVRVDLMVEKPDAYGSLLQHFTGSKHHNIALRELSLKNGYSLSDYGVKKIGDKNGKLIKFDTEEKLYKFFKLVYIPPELREDTGEIDAARSGKLPKLVEEGYIKADLQIHSSYDIETSHDLGESSFMEIVEKGNELGYEYLAFTEHNPSQSGHTENKIVDLLKRKKEAIEKINYSIMKKNTKSIQKVFNSLEIDIKPDGTLPVPDNGMDTLDFALVSIHSSFNLERDKQTKRVLSALNHPKVKIFAHPTGRKLQAREGVELNWPEIFDFCLKKHKWIEINCDPMRLDLPDVLVREAVSLGVMLTMGTDSHHKDMMDNMKYGIAVARRGWCEPKNIVNTLGLSKFEALLKKSG